MSKTLNMNNTPLVLFWSSPTFKWYPELLHILCWTPEMWEENTPLLGSRGCKTWKCQVKQISRIWYWSEFSESTLSLTETLRYIWEVRKIIEHAASLKPAKGSEDKQLEMYLWSTCNCFYIMVLLAFYKGKKPTPQKTCMRQKQYMFGANLTE